MVLAADWVSPSLARDRVHRWLRRLRWPPDDRDDVVHAVSEAVSNSVEHGYRVAPGTATLHPGTVRIEGWVVVDAAGRARHVELLVLDRGVWRSPTGEVDRPWGTALMRALTAEHVVHHGPDGTAVLLRGHPVSGHPGDGAGGEPAPG